MKYTVFATFAAALLCSSASAQTNNWFVALNGGITSGNLAASNNQGYAYQQALSGANGTLEIGNVLHLFTVLGKPIDGVIAGGANLGSFGRRDVYSYTGGAETQAVSITPLAEFRVGLRANWSVEGIVFSTDVTGGVSAARYGTRYEDNGTYTYLSTNTSYAGGPFGRLDVGIRFAESAPVRFGFYYQRGYYALQGYHDTSPGSTPYQFSRSASYHTVGVTTSYFFN